MVVKLTILCCRLRLRFESRVILDGSQTSEVVNQAGDAFESRVILDGSQTYDK